MWEVLDTQEYREWRASLSDLDKAGVGGRSWYNKMVRQADALFDRHLATSS
ncbi:hypothetical protein [Candidatus Poriferisodalis sp.]|uniref:hypothetical protein n=1 Tax=Candidatus Poriferisodalis sp. TaxID=3101277 RepID=UPI003C6ECE71